jgi:hypothetical protein
VDRLRLHVRAERGVRRQGIEAVPRLERVAVGHEELEFHADQAPAIGGGDAVLRRDRGGRGRRRRPCGNRQVRHAVFPRRSASNHVCRTAARPISSIRRRTAASKNLKATTEWSWKSRSKVARSSSRSIEFSRAQQVAARPRSVNAGSAALPGGWSGQCGGRRGPSPLRGCPAPGRGGGFGIGVGGHGPPLDRPRQRSPRPRLRRVPRGSGR